MTESVTFQLLEVGQLVIVTGGLGVPVCKRPLIVDDEDYELDKDDVTIVLEESSSRWVKVLCRLGVMWMYRYNNLRLSVVI